MKLSYHLAPHIRSGLSNRSVMGDAIITLLAIYTMAAFYYGHRALVLGAFSVVVCVVADTVCCMLRGRNVTTLDFSAVVTGLIIPLLMPATVDYRIVLAAGLFAICVVKQPFGGVGNNIFNPAAGGVAFAIVCWSSELFAYPAPFTEIPLGNEISVALSNCTAYTLSVGGVPQIDIGNLLMGLTPAPMGTANLLVLAACLLYLTMRRTVRVQQPFFMLAAVALVAWIHPRINATGAVSAFYELTAAPTLFFATFMFSDPVTTPARGMTKAAYAFVAGIMLMVFRYAGGFQISEPFALLAMNALTPLFDSGAEWLNTKVRRAAIETQEAEEQPRFAEDEEEY